MMNNDTLARFCRRQGLDFWGVGDLDTVRNLPTLPLDLFDDFTRAIILGVKLADWPLDRMKDGPSLIYQTQYQMAKAALSLAAFLLQREIERRRGRALYIAAGQMMDRSRRQYAVAHRELALTAGVGWIGKSGLIVHPRFGPRVRFEVVLTDLPLKAAPRRISSRCGDCRACLAACPSGALQEDKEYSMDAEKCLAFIKQCQTQNPLITEHICGVCVAVCPWGHGKPGVNRPRTKSSSGDA